MLYAIVSDLHANLVAWKAVLADLTALKAKRIICLGDVVGYGPQPAAVLEDVYRRIDAFVMGNHDAVVGGKMSSENFNDRAREMVEWSTAQITARGRAFLGRQPLVLQAPGFVCAHGSLDHPEVFNYILTPEEALDTWAATDQDLVFVGHSHIPAIFVLGHSGTPHLLDAQDFDVEEGKRYIVNVGSVGDPRDDDPRASYCLYDDETRTVLFRRVAFDYEALAAAVAAAGLDPEKVPLLRRDPVGNRSVREALGFAPPSEPSLGAKDAALSATVGSLHRTNARLRNAASAAFLAFLAMAGVTSALLAHRPVPKSAMVAVPADPLPPRSVTYWDDNLVFGFPTALQTSAYDASWRLLLQNREKQHVEFEINDRNQNVRYAERTPDMPSSGPIYLTPGSHVVTIKNATRSGFALEARDMVLLADSGGSVRARVWACCGRDFRGTVRLTLVKNRGSASEKALFSHPLFNDPKGVGSWVETHKTADLGAGCTNLSFQFEGEFEGTISLAEPRLALTGK